MISSSGTSDPLAALLSAAQARSDAGDWAGAIRLFGQAADRAPASGEIQHNLALARFATGDLARARHHAVQATARAPRLWQARALLARIERARGDVGAADAAWRAVLAIDPASGPARLGLADLAMNELGDAAGAAALVAPLASDPANGVDAELTTLMAALYSGAIRPGDLARRLRDFAGTHLTLPRLRPREPRAGRRRVGLISPLFTASPVHFLTFSTWRAVAEAHDLVVFNRGTRADAATEALRRLAREWHDVAHVEPQPLAERIAAAEIDVLFDLGGWSDVAGLAALSARPAARLYKWVGGQSATTGIAAFDGWIGDGWQSPAEAQPLYAEPLLPIAGGYIDYAAPPGIAALRDRPRSGVALVGNPVKITAALAAHWPADVRAVSLIDRRYAHAATRERVAALLDSIGVAVAEVLTPDGHHGYLEAVARHAAIVNTVPYAAGLTAVEAYALGVKVIGPASGGPLFAQRHLLSHARTRGRNPALAPQILALIAR